MAKAYPSGATGAVALPTGYNADIASYEWDESQDMESVAFYSTNLYNPMRGSGTFSIRAVVAAFATYGASTLTPGFGGGTTPATSNVGGAATFTVATGVTMVGSMVVGRIHLSHARLRAAIPVSFELANSADTMVTTWPVA